MISLFYCTQPVFLKREIEAGENTIVSLSVRLCVPPPLSLEPVSVFYEIQKRGLAIKGDLDAIILIS
jgi:hypothetical protein